MVFLFWEGRRRLLSCRQAGFKQYWIQELYFACYLGKMFSGKHAVTYPAVGCSMQHCDTCVGKKPFHFKGPIENRLRLMDFRNVKGTALCLCRPLTCGKKNMQVWLMLSHCCAKPLPTEPLLVWYPCDASTWFFTNWQITVGFWVPFESKLAC